MKGGEKMTKSLTKIGTFDGKAFIAKVQEQYVNKYAQDMVQMLEDKKKLQASLDKINSWIKAVEAGDFTAIEKYKKQRARLESEENGEFE